MSTYEEQLKRTRECIVKDDPWISGTVDVPEHFLNLYYTEKPAQKPSHLSASVLSLDKSVTSIKLSKLADACEPATFGRGKDDVFDEAYRKAGKMETKSFATPFDVHQIGILDQVMAKLFRGPDADKPIRAELYKLNVYGPGSFFKSHKDTPRTTKMFGSLVIVFPTVHKGGSLALRHDEKEFIFDSSTIVSESINSVAYVAFFSDVEHEVLPVTEGYRITLTYNLYHAALDGSNKGVRASINEILELKNNISALLDNPTFLSEGGLLGFGLRFSYPVETVEKCYSYRLQKQSGFDQLITHLKGSDDLIKTALTELGLPAYLRGIVQDDFQLMISHPCDDFGFSSDEGACLVDQLLEHTRGQLIHNLGEDPKDAHYLDGSDQGKTSKEVAWITESSKYSKSHSTYVALGNDAQPSSFYADLCLMAPIGPAGDRENVDVYEGVEIDGYE